MEQHNNYVQSVTPSARFHMVELSEGWEPLCNILKKPVPNMPFPRANDAEAVESVAKGIMKEAALRWLLIFVTAGAVGRGLLWWLQRQ